MSVNDEQFRWLNAVLWRIVTDAGGVVELGELTIDRQAINGIIVETDDGIVRVTALPDYVAVGSNDPEPPDFKHMNIGNATYSGVPAKMDFMVIPQASEAEKLKAWRDYLQRKVADAFDLPPALLDQYPDWSSVLPDIRAQSKVKP